MRTTEMIAGDTDSKVFEPIFEAPGPGPWQHDPAHWPGPVTPWTAEAFSSGFRRGFSESTRRYGVLLSHLEPALVNGQLYMQPVPVASEAEAAIRMQTTKEAFESRLWRRDLALWDDEFKPDSIRRNRGLQSVDPADLSDARLARHLRECRDNQEEMAYRHHKFNMAAMLPVGRFAASVTEWTGASTGEVLDLLRGSTPISRGIADAELKRVGEALRGSGVGPESFEPGLSAACIVDRLQSAPGELGEAVRGYLEACGAHAAAGYDVTYPTVREMPDFILRNFWEARQERRTEGSDETARRIERLRAAVPVEKRGEFDELLAEARHVSRLRDERGLFNDVWAAGISRLAIQEVGRRLAVRGRLDREELVFAATMDEMVALLEGSPLPASRELEARLDRVRATPQSRVPATLGGDPPPPPPLDGLPDHARLAARAIELVIGEILGSPQEASAGAIVRGRGASPGIYEGRARVITDPAGYNKVVRGDVLVTISTSASVNVVLPLLGAIVTDRGGLLSHAAIVAREYGIPGVVDGRKATQVIPDGAKVRVDGTRGTVEVIR